MITAYLNLGDPASWLAIGRIRQLINETGVQIEIRPMIGSLGNVVARAKPGEDDPLANYKARRAAARSKASAREAERMAEMLGVSLAQLSRVVDPSLLSLGLSWLNEHDAVVETCLDYCEAAFAAVFTTAQDVEDTGVVAELLRSTGGSDQGFTEYIAERKQSVPAEAEALLEQGLLSAPAFVVDGEIFHGREHLPLITWMVDGRQGPPPV